MWFTAITTIGFQSVFITSKGMCAHLCLIQHIYFCAVKECFHVTFRMALLPGVLVLSRFVSFNEILIKCYPWPSSVERQ